MKLKFSPKKLPANCLVSMIKSLVVFVIVVVIGLVVGLLQSGLWPVKLNEKEAVQEVRNSYNKLYNAYVDAIIEHGNPVLWELNGDSNHNAAVVAKKLAPHLGKDAQFSDSLPSVFTLDNGTRIMVTAYAAKTAEILESKGMTCMVRIPGVNQSLHFNLNDDGTISPFGSPDIQDARAKCSVNEERYCTYWILQNGNFDFPEN